jgi:hypothetical protein
LPLFGQRGGRVVLKHPVSAVTGEGLRHQARDSS